MFRRSILELTSRRPVGRIQTHIVTQIPSYLSSRKEFSVKSQQNEPHGSGSTSKQSESGSFLPKFFIGSAALGAAFITAYQTGYLDKFIVKEPHNNLESAKMGDNLNDMQDLTRPEDSKASEHVGEQLAQESKASIPDVNRGEENREAHSEVTHMEDLSKNEGESQFKVKDTSHLSPKEDITDIQEKWVPSSIRSMSDDASVKSGELIEKQVEPHMKEHVADDSTSTSSQTDAFAKENEINSVISEDPIIKDLPEDIQGNIIKEPGSVLDEYYLRENDEVPTAVSSNKPKDLVGAAEDLNAGYIDKDGKLILDFLQAIHAAEKRQAELDAIVFTEEKRIMKEKYQKELNDARARELMYAEREAILDKELNKEKVKAAAALKSLQEKLEEKYKMELEKKEAEAELELKKMQDLAKAELTAAIAHEKASQIEKMAEANLHINALCMAFYARSEEARQSHSIHNLALGALALEDALSKGLPIQKEIDALHTYLKGLDDNSLLNLVLCSLPEETRNHGTDTLLQLTLKFDALKGTLYHFSLIPPGGGGILAHSLAHIASWLKVREVDQSGDGIESLINRVESLLAEGKLSEAADTLETGVKGSQAAEVVGDWVKKARNRAITEQALTLLQSYATSIRLT